MGSSNISVVILTYNGENYLPQLLDKLAVQSVKFELIIIDSSSSDLTHTILKTRGVDYVIIPKNEFNHGGTRNLALNYTKGDIVVYLTQDAIPHDEFAIEYIANGLLKENAAIAYGRQLPYPNSSVLSTFARLANYPAKSLNKNKSLIPKLGIKTCHLSNSFSAYKVDVLKQLGGFPKHCIMCEDVYVGAKAILEGYSIYYHAEAKVMHSHNYTIAEEFKRYFDIGVFYNNEYWILKNFSKAESEGIHFIVNEFKFLSTKGKWYLIPEWMIRTMSKYLGYRLGKIERKLSNNFKKRISMHKYYWI